MGASLKARTWWWSIASRLSLKMIFLPLMVGTADNLVRHNVSMPCGRLFSDQECRSAQVSEPNFPRLMTSWSFWSEFLAVRLSFTHAIEGLICRHVVALRAGKSV